ncbi:MAG: LCP family protein [Pseudonocardiales bacterium]
MLDGSPRASGQPAQGGRHRSRHSAQHLPRQRPWRLVAAVGLVIITVIGGGLVGTVMAAANKYNNNIQRIQPFAAPSPGATKVQARATLDGAANFLVVGSDSRAQDPMDPKQFATVGVQRTDTIMLVHLQADHKHGYVVSIPRDAYVYIPPGGNSTGAKLKINAAYAYGGIQLLTKTVEQFTGEQVDHVVVISFQGLENVVDALGGVDVTVDHTTYDTETHRTFKKGVNHLNGEQALFYVRQRHGLDGGDLDRIKRQHQFLAALLGKAGSTGTLTNPLKLHHFLDAASKSMAVDQDLQLTDLVLQFRGLRPGDFTFLTMPIAGDATVPGVGDVLLVDHARAAEMFTAMSADTLAAWVVAHPQFVSNQSHGA